MLEGPPERIIPQGFLSSILLGLSVYGTIIE